MAINNQVTYLPLTKKNSGYNNVQVWVMEGWENFSSLINFRCPQTKIFDNSKFSTSSIFVRLEINKISRKREKKVIKFLSFCIFENQNKLMSNWANFSDQSRVPLDS